MRDFFDREGVLYRCLPRYEHRPQQMEMAEAVLEALDSERLLLVEAGTGVGKSLAYLVPLILKAVEKGKKVFVATGTKTLQHQLITKELPFLKKYLGVDFSYALCVGADNYLCERRLAAIPTDNQSTLFADASEIQAVRLWAEICSDGMRSELDFPVSPQTWYQVCRVPELCAGQDCGRGGKCFYQRARRRMNRAEVLVGNHHLLFANLRSDWESLPKCHYLVIDEAHNLDGAASDCLGFEFSHRSMRRVWEGLRGKDGRGGLIGSLHELPLEIRQELLHSVRETEQKMAETLHWFQEHVLEGNPRVRVSHTLAVRGLEHFTGHLSELVASLKLVARKIEDDEKALECSGYAQRLERTLDEAQSVIQMAEDAPWLLWCEEITPRSGDRGNVAESAGTAVFHATPLDPGELLAEKLYPEFDSTVLVSATLSIAGDFSYTRNRLGIPKKKSAEISLPSPFNHRENLVVYSPPHLADPQRFDDYIEDLSREIVRLVTVIQGGSFILCTSHQILNVLYDRFRREVSARCWDDVATSSRNRRNRSPSSGRDLLVLRQGEASRERLLEVFRKHGKAVLFGAATFWQGVDVPGRALELVVITRLPFQVPDDPVLEAKIQRCRNLGGNPFYEIQVPHAVMQFRQGIGRLIRSHSDRGVVALLDSRVVTKSYGKFFLESLPECRVTDDIEAVKTFLLSG